MDKNEKERRKKILNELRKKAQEEFEQSLPMSRDNFKKLFDYLDKELREKGCDTTNRLTTTFLHETGEENVPVVLDWMASKGGYCDCEILANVGEQFE